MPYVMSNIVELGVRQQNMNYVITEGIIMIVLALCALGCSLVTVKLNSKFVAQVITEIRRDVFVKVNSLTFEQFSSIGTGSLITRTTDDVGSIEDSLFQVPYILVSVPVYLIGGIVLSFRGDWTLPLILLGVSVVALLVVTAITSHMDRLWQRGDEYTDVQNRVMRERLSGIRVVRAFDREGYEQQRARSAINVMNNSFVKANTISGLVNPISSLCLNLATVAIIYIGAMRLQNPEIMLKAGDVLATIQYIALIVNAILILSWMISFIPHVKVCAGRIGEILDTENTHDGESMNVKLDGQINFSDVSFCYPLSHKNALSNVNFNVSLGETVGIIGGTGSGKTTLLKVLMDFYPINCGTRTFGGVDYNSVTPSTIRDNLSVALQKTMIFEGSVRDNVKMGNFNATDEQILHVMHVCQLDGFLSTHDGGLDYMLTESGNNISGGQKQRISIARTIIKPASVYVFDDSFSALDFLTESNLRKEMNKYLNGATQIIITQRVATAMRCDKVYVMDGGKVVGYGTHKELLKTCRTYKEIYDSQLGGGTNEN